MTKRSLLSTWKYQLTEPVYPNVGIEINSDCIRLATVTPRKGSVQVDHMESVAIPPDSVQINPFKPNILDWEPVTIALKDLWSRNRNRPPKICLLLQDRTALAFQMNLETSAANEEECLELVRFKLKKNIPFRVEDARINYFLDSGAHDFHSSNLWVTVMNSQVLRQYEELIQATLGIECGLVDLATFNLMNLAHAEIHSQGLEQQDHLYVNLNRSYISLAITQKEKLMFFRSRELERQNGIIQEALAEIHPTVLFYLDKLGGQQFSRAFVYALESPEELSRSLEQAHNVKAILLNPVSTLRESKVFAPLLGMLMSRKVEFL
jgi:type IV pilus assembly protein PilM